MSKQLIKGDPSVPRPAQYKFRLDLSSAKAIEFKKFTQLHLNQKVQIVLGTNVVAEPIYSSVVTDGRVVLFCPADEITRITEPFPKR